MNDIYDLDAMNLPYLEVSSKAFVDWWNIPSIYTCDWWNHFPDILVSWIPMEVETLVLIVDDPDAPGKTFVHMIAWNIIASWDTSIIDENTLINANIWKNDAFTREWVWPCPPRRNGVHHYYFKVYWINWTLELPDNISAQELIKQINLSDSLVAYWELIWEYER